MNRKMLSFWLSTGKFTPAERMKLKGDYGILYKEYILNPRGLPIGVLEEIFKDTLKVVDGFIVPGEPLFDKVFNNYADKPCGIFYKGDINLIESRCFTFAGSRKPSVYGVRATKEIINYMKGSEISIVSGGALGIDTTAHRAAMEAGLKTISVLGCGVNYTYPPQNRGLFQNILRAGGLILSEYLPDRKPEKYFFPERNRIMAQLGEILIIPEATEISGSLHTAACADSYGKRIITIPHEIFNESGKGCNSLIAVGAEMLGNPTEILNYI